MLPVWLVANLVAQRVYPTSTRDEAGRRWGYRMIVWVLAGAGFGLLAIIGIVTSGTLSSGF